MCGLEWCLASRVLGNKAPVCLCQHALRCHLSRQHSVQPCRWRRRAGTCRGTGGRWLHVFVGFSTKLSWAPLCSETFLSSQISPGFYHACSNQRPSWETVWTPTGTYYWKAKWEGEQGCQPIKLNIGFFSLIKLKPKQVLKVLALLWPRLGNTCAPSLEPGAASRAGDPLSPPALGSGLAAGPPVPTGGMRGNHAQTSQGSGGKNFVHKQHCRPWFMPVEIRKWAACSSWTVACPVFLPLNTVCGATLWHSQMGLAQMRARGVTGPSASIRRLAGQPTRTSPGLWRRWRRTHTVLSPDRYLAAFLGLSVPCG